MYAIAIAEGQRKQRANQPSMIDHLAAVAALIIAGLSYALRISIHGLAPLIIQYPLIIFASYNSDSDISRFTRASTSSSQMLASTRMLLRLYGHFAEERRGRRGAASRVR